MQLANITPGFDNPVAQSQQVFRHVLTALSRPGNIQTLHNLQGAPSGLSQAAAAVCLALVDFETPVWLDQASYPAKDYLKFHCSAPITDEPETACFALISDARALQDFGLFSPGSDARPETSTTLIIEVEALEQGHGMTLTGPGIATQTQLHIEGVNPNFRALVAANHSLFPCGVDLVLVSGNRLAALPRSVRVIVEN